MQCRFRFRLNSRFVAGFLRLNAEASLFLSFRLPFSFHRYSWYLPFSFFVSISLCRSLLAVSHSLRFHFRLSGSLGAGFRWNVFGVEIEKYERHKLLFFLLRFPATNPELCHCANRLTGQSGEQPSSNSLNDFCGHKALSLGERTYYGATLLVTRIVTSASASACSFSFACSSFSSSDQELCH
jgi:hypothetical protein